MMKRAQPEVEIIGFLRAKEGAYASGQTISRALGISRTAVWKHIVSLRKAGYPIEGSSRKGYMLLKPGSPPFNAPFNAIELSSAVSTETIGRDIHFFPSLDSTNAKALALARDGAPEGTVVVADSQERGRGRLGRKWISPAGTNLYTSVILRPAIPPHMAQTLTLLSAVAVAETIALFSPVTPAVKWPNDILVDSRKVAGILTEMSSETDRINFVVIGIGVNVNWDMKNAPDEIRRTATSLKEKKGADVPRVEFVAALYSSLEKWYKIFNKEGRLPIVKAWRGWFNGEGKPVKVKGSPDTKGLCLGIDDFGALLVRLSSGNIARVVAGDVE
ncbi:MAG: biotin--[acetyl-CoA-carboxylase] ligase [Deltaproteobacteria bacterium]|nr:biotin--[acetyl-CoA-carboxylase] ligase [Deltaproteobacteria bacterium]